MLSLRKPFVSTQNCTRRPPCSSSTSSHPPCVILGVVGTSSGLGKTTCRAGRNCTSGSVFSGSSHLPKKEPNLSTASSPPGRNSTAIGRDKRVPFAAQLKGMKVKVVRPMSKFMDQRVPSRAGGGMPPAGAAATTVREEAPLARGNAAPVSRLPPQRLRPRAVLRRTTKRAGAAATAQRARGRRAGAVAGGPRAAESLLGCQPRAAGPRLLPAA
mmetsp:Transcript_47175/g.95219  ORF Transcript_47175/g.95219 Transcript_47175/m.95219 type:complete len:214 (-) Transcript_47175:29-670(-)